jgi:hypothetical protein
MLVHGRVALTLATIGLVLSLSAPQWPTHPVVAGYAALPTLPPLPLRSSVPSAGYHVVGNQIVNSSGAPLIIKGADAVYGRFAGGDPAGYGLSNYRNARRDIANLAGAGVNTIRVSVSYNQFLRGPLSPVEYLTELDQVVSWITQAGLVASLSQSSSYSTNVVSFVTMLASRYKANPLVWITPEKEPSCSDGSHGACWGYWQSIEQLYMRAMRIAGNTQPSIVNCVGWSWDCSQVGSYLLGDSNVVYGAHRYGNGLTTFSATQQADCDAKWANLSLTYPIVVDEVGVYDPPASPLTWSAGFLDYATNWVRTRQEVA